MGLSKYSVAFHLLLLTYVCPLSNAQAYPNHIKSTIAPGASIDYKSIKLCETTAGVRSFSGYVRLPHSVLEGAGGANEYDAHMFFWYIEARNNPQNAPLALYTGGGPGATALTGVTAENGPCKINADSNSTSPNPWSWNNNVNMLYIDQPVQVGFSYDELVASTLDTLTGTITPVNGSMDAIQTNATFLKGILPTQNIGAAANTTANAAKIMWTFAQVWLREFPEHDTSDDRVSMWSNSYGGHWAPAIMAHFESQNRKIRDGTLQTCLRNTTLMNLDTLGFTNGCVDSKIEAPLYPQMAFNNTYGLQAITEGVYKEAMNNLTKPGGCNDLIEICRDYAAADPENTGTNTTINDACAVATTYCWQFVQGAYAATSQRNAFDMSRKTLAVFPPQYIIGFMNQEWVREELGVPVNFSISGPTIVPEYFGVTGDPFHVSIDTINYVAQSGIKVAMVFGDRDYRCNWLGGEAVSLAMEYLSSPAFRSSGYASIQVSSNQSTGLVRQHDKISFSRVFDAGHNVGAFQPETVSQIFDRVMFNKDVATGGVDITSDYSTQGPISSFDVKNKLPDSPENECYALNPIYTCTVEQMEALKDGSAVVSDYILKDIAK